MGFTDIRFIYGFFPLLLFGGMILGGRTRRIFLTAGGVVLYGFMTVPGMLFALCLFLFTGLLCRYMSGRSVRKGLAAGLGMAGIILFPIIWRVTGFGAIRPGLGFFTLSCLTCVIDTYRQRQTGQESMLSFALYLFYPPRLFFGPAQEFHAFLEDYGQSRGRIRTNDWFNGACRMAFGQMKILLAGRGLYGVYEQLLQQKSPALVSGWIAAALFGLLLVLVCSGLTDAALGFSSMLGVELPENTGDVWRLSSVAETFGAIQLSVVHWFEVYVYEPVGKVLYERLGIRIGPARGMAYFAAWMGGMLFFSMDASWAAGALFLAVPAALWHVRRMSTSRENPGLLTRLLTLFLSLIGLGWMAGGSFAGAVRLQQVMWGISSKGFINDSLLFILREHLLLLIVCVLLGGVRIRSALMKRLDRIGKRGARYVMAALLYIALFCVCMSSLMGSDPIRFLEVNV